METSVKRIYEDFEPYCKWRVEEERDTLELQLQDFKKEQLKVQINNLGVLRISGERATSDEIKWSRFNKEIKVAKNCETSAIQAKFGNGTLTITMPKKIPSVATLPSVPPVQEKGNATPGVQENNKVSDEIPKVGSTGNIQANENASLDGTRSISKLVQGNKMTLKVVVVAVVVAALGAYVTYKYRQPSQVEN
ncbi:inactive protein RESTRICTED TEV MOVEMENT 2-like [Fagus crenata]